MKENSLKDLQEISDLPSEWFEKEIKTFIEKSGKKADNLSLDELREVLSEYVRQELLKAKETFEEDFYEA